MLARADATALLHLAALDEAEPLDGEVIVAEIDGRALGRDRPWTTRTHRSAIRSGPAAQVRALLELRAALLGRSANTWVARRARTMTSLAPRAMSFPAGAVIACRRVAEGGSDQPEADEMIATETTQVHEVEIRATPQEIWTALTTSVWTQRYGYRGRVEYELRPGGAFRAYATPEMAACGAPEIVVDGEVIEAAAPHRLVQTWHANFDPTIAAEPAGPVTYELEPGAPGFTKVTITHELDGAPITAAIVGGHLPEAGGGWRFVLDDLKRALEEETALAA